jgi:hypothetical protein
MEYPPSLSPKQASKLIVDAEHRIAEGIAKSGRIPNPIKSCKHCGVKFATQRFNYCPICAVNNAQQIELQDNDMPALTLWHKLKEKTYDILSDAMMYILGLLVLVATFVFVVGCIETFRWMF